MVGRIVWEFVLLCLAVDVILVAGSPRIYDRRARNPRHASCPSCARDRPDALASWSMPPSPREYRGIESEIVHRPRNEPFESSPYSSYPYGPYNRALGGREASAIANRAENTCKRENPFAFQRKFDSNVASAPSSSLYNVDAPVTPYQPRVSAFERTPYRTSSFYDAVRPQSDLSTQDQYSDYYSPVEEPYFEGVERLRNAYEASKKNIHTVYRADRLNDDSVEDEYPNARSEQYSGWQVPDLGSPAGSRMPGVDRSFQSRRDQSREIKHSAYNLSPEFDVLRTMQNVARDGIVGGNGSVWQNRKEQEPERSPPGAVEIVYGRDGAVKKTNDDDRGNDGRDPREDQSQDEFKGKRDAAGKGIPAEDSKEFKESKTTQEQPLNEEGPLESIEVYTEPEPVEIKLVTGPLMLP